MMKEIEVTASKAQVHGTSKDWWRSQVAHVGCIPEGGADSSQKLFVVICGSDHIFIL